MFCPRRGLLPHQPSVVRLGGRVELDQGGGQQEDAGDQERGNGLRWLTPRAGHLLVATLSSQSTQCVLEPP